MFINCPNCAKALQAPATLAGKAVRCPSCSQPLTLPAPVPVVVPAPALPPLPPLPPAPKKLPRWAWFAAGAVVLVLLSCAGLAIRGGRPAAQAEDQAEDQAAAPAFNVTAADLLADYRDNEAAARMRYGKGRVRVRGRVRGFLGKAVLLERFPAVTCFGLTRPEVAGLREGDEATVEGRVTLGNSGGVHLTNCKLVE